MQKSIKELSKELNCSYEAVRQQIKRYNSELSGHITKNGKTQLLDEYACEFLKSKRTENPVVLQTIEKDEYTKQLEQENKTLLIAVNELQKELLQAKEDKHTLELENLELRLLKAKNEEPGAEPKKRKWWQRK